MSPHKTKKSLIQTIRKSEAETACESRQDWFAELVPVVRGTVARFYAHLARRGEVARIDFSGRLPREWVVREQQVPEGVSSCSCHHMCPATCCLHVSDPTSRS